MIKIPLTHIKQDGGQYVIYPRVELITDCLLSKQSIYESLCLVLEHLIQQCPVRFFSGLDSRENYIIYRHILESIRKQTIAAVSLNMSINFLETNYVDMPLSEFGGNTLILGLAESSPLESITQVQARELSVQILI
jgi:hypothetical protein